MVTPPRIVSNRPPHHVSYHFFGSGCVLLKCLRTAFSMCTSLLFCSSKGEAGEYRDQYLAASANFCSFGESGLSSLIVYFCLTSKVSRGGRWRRSCESTNCDSYRSWLHRVVRPNLLSVYHAHGGLRDFWERVRGQGIPGERARKKSEDATWEASVAGSVNLSDVSSSQGSWCFVGGTVILSKNGSDA